MKRTFNPGFQAHSITQLPVVGRGFIRSTAASQKEHHRRDRPLHRSGESGLFGLLRLEALQAKRFYSSLPGRVTVQGAALVNR